MIVDSDVLRFFQQIADGVTVTEVAELYQVSQPGVSRSLKRLEEEVGTSLLERSGDGPYATYARQAHGVMERFDEPSRASTPEEVADFLHPYIEAGCSVFNVIPCATDHETAVSGVSELRRLLAATRAHA